MIQDIIDQQDREIDELLRLLNLDPDQYRTDGGSVNLPKVKAALAHPDEYPRLADAERYRWLQERVTSTGLAHWMGPHQTLNEAVDAARAALPQVATTQPTASVPPASLCPHGYPIVEGYWCMKCLDDKWGKPVTTVKSDPAP